MKKCNPRSPKANDPGYECNHATGRWIKKRRAAVKKAVAAPAPPAAVKKAVIVPHIHHNVATLRMIARDRGHRGYSKMRKAQLLALLLPAAAAPPAAKKAVVAPPAPAAVKKAAEPWQELEALVTGRGIDFVVTTRTDIAKKFDPTGWIGAVSQQVLDRFTDRPYTMYDFLDQISERKPELSEAAMKKIRARPDAAHLLHVVEHATAKYRGRNDPFTLYHGTDTRSARAIIETGIELARGGGRHGTGFYVTPQPSYSLSYASSGRPRAGHKETASPCVLQLRLDAAEAKRLVFGDDFTFDMTSPMDPTAFNYHRFAGYLANLIKIIKRLPKDVMARFIVEHVSPEAFPEYNRADEKKREEIVQTATKRYEHAPSLDAVLNRKINSAWVESKRSIHDLPPTVRDELRYSAYENRGGIKIIAKSEATVRALQVVRCFVMRY